VTSLALDPAALRAAHFAYLAAVRASQGPSSVVEAIVASYLKSAGDDKSLKPIRRQGGVSPNTIAISRMEVGDLISLRAAAQSSVRNVFATARRIMENPDARWATSKAERGVFEVRRLPDGMIGRDPRRNTLAVELAALEIGDSQVFKVDNYTRHRSAYQVAKNQARRILGDDGADWSYKITSKGARVVRIDPDPVKSDLRGMRIPKDMQRIARQVMERHSVTASELVEMDRRPHVAAARHELIGRIFDLTDRHGQPRYTKVQIGKLIGRRDHSTINNSVARWEEMKASAKEARHAA
jgi:hypothetical protein